MSVDIAVIHGGSASIPPVAEGVKVEFDRKGSPGKLTFTVITQSKIAIDNGDAVQVRVAGKPFFYGYVFSIKNTGTGDKQEITVYDQLRYLKNKHSYVFANQSADQIIRTIAADFILETGVIEQTGFTIPSRVEDNQTLFDVIQGALDQTLLNTGELFVLYDDCGKLSLRNVRSMAVGYLIDTSNAGDFTYERSIDRATYNRIRVVVEEGGDSGQRNAYQAQDSSSIARWGVLQLTEKAETAATAKSKASQMLTYYNRETRSLSLKSVFGDIRVRAGCSVPVTIDLGDVVLQQFLVVEKAQHIFRENEHFMDLVMKGGIITG